MMLPGQLRPKHVPILTSLRFNLVGIAVLVTVVYLVCWVYGHHRLGDNLAAVSVEKTGSAMEADLGAFFQPAIDGFEMARMWARSGTFQPRDASRSVALLLPFEKAHPQITSITTGDAEGQSFRIGIDPEGFVVRCIRSGQDASQSMMLLDWGGRVMREWQAPREYDPRTRQWYLDATLQQAACASGALASPSWTSPYIFHTANAPGLSLSGPLEGPDKTRFFMTFNVELERISDFSVLHVPSPGGLTFILSDTGNVIGLPAGPKFLSQDGRRAFFASFPARLPTLGELGIPALSEAGKSLRLETSTVRMSGAGEPFILHLRPFPIPNGKPMWIGIVIPEADLFQEFRRQRSIIIFVTAALLIFCWVMAANLSYWYANPLRLLADESRLITMLELETKASIDSTILEVHQLARAHERMKAALDSFSRYVPLVLVRKLLEAGTAAKLEYTSREITVLFTDIRNSTSLAESFDPTTLSAHLTNYYENMMGRIRHHSGLIDKLVGDAIMALWGTPHDDAHQCANAVRAALACRDFLQEFNARSLSQGLPELHTRFGLASGAVMVGNFGSPDRMFYTAVGDKVNLASRLEGLNKTYGTQIMAEETVVKLAGEGFAWRLLDIVAVKGKARSLRVYELLGVAGTVPDTMQRFAEAYERALGEYLNRRFAEAERMLDGLASPHTGDLSVGVLLDKTRRFLKEPPPPDWDGVTRFQTK
ncbi:adenylate/guanylate cyclase domain-containing protein [Candidatus Ozemobacteraceae bacterium]|nr:adenylate/guanylate cyclase domain-containing protein [Candidatus Ozemobacteraceae bacterium]